MLCAAHIFRMRFPKRDVSCFFWAVVRFPNEMSCFCVYNFRVKFPYESSCFWLGNLLSRFPNEISCFLALMRFHEISLLYFTLFFSIPDEISLWDFMLFGRCKISLWECMLLGCKACLRVILGIGRGCNMLRRGVMLFGRYEISWWAFMLFWPWWNFFMRAHAFGCRT